MTKLHPYEAAYQLLDGSDSQVEALRLKAQRRELMSKRPIVAKRIFTEKQRAAAVARVYAGDGRLSVAESIGVPYSTLSNWIVKARQW